MHCSQKGPPWERKKTWDESQPSNEQREPGNSLALPGNHSATSHHPGYFPVIHRMQINSFHGPQWPQHSHGCKQASSISSQQVEKFPGSEEQISSSEAPFAGSWELGAASAPRPASNRSQEADPAIWQQPIWALHLNAFLPKGGTFLEHVLLRQQHTQNTKGKT